ncbi:hypothetical protein [Lysinibacillus sp. NPDC093216]
MSIISIDFCPWCGSKL